MQHGTAEHRQAERQVCKERKSIRYLLCGLLDKEREEKRYENLKELKYSLLRFLDKEQQKYHTYKCQVSLWSSHSTF